MFPSLIVKNLGLLIKLVVFCFFEGCCPLVNKYFWLIMLIFLIVGLYLAVFRQKPIKPLVVCSPLGLLYLCSPDRPCEQAPMTLHRPNLHSLRSTNAFGNKPKKQFSIPLIFLLVQNYQKLSKNSFNCSRITRIKRIFFLGQQLSTIKDNFYKKCF